MRGERTPHTPGGTRGYPLWSITKEYPNGGQLQELHSGATKQEAVTKALRYDTPPFPTIRRAFIATYYKGNPVDLVI